MLTYVVGSRTELLLCSHLEVIIVISVVVVRRQCLIIG